MHPAIPTHHHPHPGVNFIGLPPDQEQDFHTAERLLDWTVALKWDPAVTHLVVPTEKVGVEIFSSKRSLKYLQTVTSGRWVVSFDWVKGNEMHGKAGRARAKLNCLTSISLLACLAAQQTVAEVAYEVAGDVKHESWCNRSPERARISRAMALRQEVENDSGLSLPVCHREVASQCSTQPKALGTLLFKNYDVLFLGAFGKNNPTK